MKLNHHGELSPCHHPSLVHHIRICFGTTMFIFQRYVCTWFTHSPVGGAHEPPAFSTLHSSSSLRVLETRVSSFPHTYSRLESQVSPAPTGDSSLDFPPRLLETRVSRLESHSSSRRGGRWGTALGEGAGGRRWGRLGDGARGRCRTSGGRARVGKLESRRVSPAPVL